MIRHSVTPNIPTYAKGFTLLGLLFILCLVGFFGYSALRIAPAYQEYFSMSQALTALSNEPGMRNKSPAQVKQELLNRFYISYVETPTEKNIKVSRSSGYLVQVKYEVRRPFLGNLDFVAQFEKTVTL